MRFVSYKSGGSEWYRSSPERPVEYHLPPRLAFTTAKFASRDSDAGESGVGKPVIWGLQPRRTIPPLGL